MISGLEKGKGYEAICAIEYTHDQKSRDKRSAKIKDKNSDDGKKIMGLIENFSEMKGACNNWAGMYWNIITSMKMSLQLLLRNSNLCNFRFFIHF